MGAGLPSAMSASILYPGRRVLAVCGDGGFMMNSQEMETAVRLGLNLVVLIMEDYAYGMIRWKQAVDGFADWGLTFGDPDFVKYAEAYGAKGSRVETADGLVPALGSGVRDGRSASGGRAGGLLRKQASLGRRAARFGLRQGSVSASVRKRSSFPPLLLTLTLALALTLP